MSLDVSSPQFEQWLKKASKIVTKHASQHSEQHVFAGKSPREVQALFEEPLPSKGEPIDEVLRQVQEKVLSSITNSAGPRYFGYITGGGNQAAVLAEMIKASLNQNNLKWHSSPVSTEMERLVMQWVAEFIGYSTESAGVLLSGGSVANFNAMAVARKIKSPVDVAEDGMYGSPPQTVYVSAEGHSSFDKAVDMLGIGKKYLRKIPVGDDLKIDLNALEEQIKSDKANGCHPICAIGIAGTTNTGTVDNLNGVADICEAHDLWYHVDAAYGGPAARVQEKAHLFDGMQRAHSVVVNPHKWLYVPFEAGGLLVKNPGHLRETFSTIPDYLKSDQAGDGRTDLMEYNLPLTKEFKALKVWMTLKTYGARKLTATIQRDIEKAQYLVNEIEKADHLEMMAPAPLSIVCFRYNFGQVSPKKLTQLNDEIINRVEQDGRIFLTGTKINGQTALRVCFINHRTSNRDVEAIIKVVTEIGQNTAQKG